MKEWSMAMVYFLICVFLITIGSLTQSPRYTQFFILPIGLAAIVFQRCIHRGRLKDLGFQICSSRQLGKAVAFPVRTIALIFSFGFIFGIIKIQPLSEVHNPFTGQMGVSLKELMAILVNSTLFTFIGSLVSEELGFRGYLIARLKKFGDFKALLFSSLLFGLWHFPPSLLLLRSGIARSIIYALNMFLLGIMFGSLFLESKSLIPSSLAHGVWNSLEYSLFGYGNVQAVFVGNSRMIFDPEEGLIGTAILLIFASIALRKARPEKIKLNASRKTSRTTLNK